jgi:hypothetical protein
MPDPYSNVPLDTGNESGLIQRRRWPVHQTIRGEGVQLLTCTNQLEQPVQQFTHLVRHPNTLHLIWPNCSTVTNILLSHLTTNITLVPPSVPLKLDPLLL